MRSLGVTRVMCRYWLFAWIHTAIVIFFLITVYHKDTLINLSTAIIPVNDRRRSQSYSNLTLNLRHLDDSHPNLDPHHEPNLDPKLDSHLNPHLNPNLATLGASPFIRAAVLYFPSTSHSDQIKSYLAELRWFLSCWRHILSLQPATWRIDVIIVTTESLKVFTALGCDVGRPRSSREEASMCRVVTGYKPITSSTGNNTGLRRGGEQEGKSYFYNYPYVESVNVMLWLGSSGHLSTHTYHHVLRTDIDTFLTPAFARWRPPPNKLVVGEGGYIGQCLEDPGAASSNTSSTGYLTCHRLRRISQYLRLGDGGISSVSSTWYGPVQLVLDGVQLSLDVMRYLERYEFTKVEREVTFWRNATNWPEWHYGVLTMYGGHLAVNHLAARGQVLQLTQPCMLDCFTNEDATCSTNTSTHLHSWHTYGRFSKFDFFQGKYKHVAISGLNLTVCQDYATYWALYSNRNKRKSVDNSPAYS